MQSVQVFMKSELPEKPQNWHLLKYFRVKQNRSIFK